METKKEIRTYMLKKRRELPSEKKSHYSREITGHLITHPLFVHSEEIYCYASCEEEVDTFKLMEAAWKQGKKVALPKVTGDRSMEFFYVDNRKELKRGHRGILEPRMDRPVKGRPALMILPGVAFDCKGNRLGYGGGFYDCYLETHPGHRKIGLAFSLQCVSELPALPHDVRVEAVVTEKGWYDLC